MICATNSQIAQQLIKIDRTNTCNYSKTYLRYFVFVIDIYWFTLMRKNFYYKYLSPEHYLYNGRHVYFKNIMYLIFLASLFINLKVIVQSNGFHYTFSTPHTVPLSYSVRFCFFPQLLLSPAFL